MTLFALLFTICAIGISETSYLIKKRIALEKPICFIGQNCAIVLSSVYNKLFGVPNDILGLIFYVIGACITAFFVIGIQPLWLWDAIFKTIIIAGSVLSLFLVYLQWKVINAWCFWCIMSACTIWLMGIILLINALY
jgi:uncharacterized membrane protein